MGRTLLIVVALFFCVAEVSFCQKATSPPLTKKPKDKDQRQWEVVTRPYSGGFPGANGLPGMPGARGDQGGPGAKEAAGEKEDRGNSGFNGPQGVKGDRGATGPEGTKGDRGSRGHAGPPGKIEQSGPKRDRGDVGPIFPANWKQCVWNTVDNKNDPKLKECSFNKLRTRTALKVSFQGNMGVYGSGTKCNRWYFKFNGNECSGPMTIEAVVYNFWPSGSPNLLQHRSFEGYCENLPRAAITVELWVGSCAGLHTQGIVTTGWNSVSRIMVEEVPRSQ